MIERPLAHGHRRARRRDGDRSQHWRLIPLLGIPIGEFWLLDELARDCAADSVYECMVTVAPLNLPGGVGSPANAYAIK